MKATPFDAATEHYLTQLGQALSVLPNHECEDIVAETRSHLHDRLQAGGSEELERSIAALGPPGAYAAQFLRDFQINQAMASKSAPAMLLQTLKTVRHGFLGLVASLIFLFLFYLVLGNIATAIVEIVRPELAGFWAGRNASGVPYAFFGISPPLAKIGAPELLGRWVIPIALLVAFGIYKVTARLLRLYLVFYQSRQRSEQG